jgi:hypothetical protein
MACALTLSIGAAANAAPPGRVDLVLSIPITNPIEGTAALVIDNVGTAPATNVVLDVLGAPSNLTGQYRIDVIPAGGSAPVRFGYTSSPLFFSGFVRSAQQDANYFNNFWIGITT